jgi:hypothetical protein
LDEAATARLDKFLRRARKRVHSKRFDTFLRVLFELAGGTFEGFGAEEPETDREIMEKGAGVDLERLYHLAGIEPNSQDDIETILRDSSRLVLEHPLGEELKTLTDEQLLEARDEVRSWLALVGGYSLVLDQALGRGAFELSGLGRAIRDMKAQEQALWLLLWAVSRYRRPGELRKGLEDYGKSRPEMHEGLRDWENLLARLERVRTEVPALSDVLAPRRIKAALRNPQELERFETELDEASRKIAEMDE